MPVSLCAVAEVAGIGKGAGHPDLGDRIDIAADKKHDAAMCEHGLEIHDTDLHLTQRYMGPAAQVWGQGDKVELASGPKGVERGLGIAVVESDGGQDIRNVKAGDCEALREAVLQLLDDLPRARRIAAQGVCHAGVEERIDALLQVVGLEGERFAVSAAADEGAVERGLSE